MEENQDIVKEVEYKGSKITLVGTAHVSQKSVDLVEEMIESDRFDCVAVELCTPRFEKIRDKNAWKDMDIFQVFKQGKASLLLVNLAMAAYQKRLAEKLGVEPGQEMIRAIDLAGEKNTRLELIDRDVSTTLRRLLSKVSLWQKMKIFMGLVTGLFVGEEIDEAQIESLKEGDMLHSVVEEFSDELPQVKEVLIDERDRFMVGKLVQLAESADAPKNILAVVGAGHLYGMLPAFNSPPQAEEFASLDFRPPPGRGGYYFGWAICLIVLSFFYVGYQKSPELGWQIIGTWVLVNGGLSALGAAIALAHPISVLTAFFAAPLTSLNPTVGAGMVVGLVESWIRKPKVSDFELLRTDLSHLSGWRSNGVLRVFLIFFCANTGSAIGTYVAGASIVTQIWG
ncbi:MAG: TraB/GumN family protein [Candidatus Nitrohelix vancouverensis]|uniref:TraB/GumN family protein n=1 Tax=Candidatus Nitrohelix vancouverensis TaxID=2705534 RepID=A0A7T0C4H1_9BACT|nr:MAG: TraB/GumN family protein [Candidatus Nitrohelix vancouverensis]